MITRRFVLDTSALLAHFRREPGGARVQALFEEVGCETPERLSLADTLIAAVARERGACLVHRDRHMAPIPESLLEQIDLSNALP